MTRVFCLQHFSFYQTFIRFSLASKKERCITILYHVKKMQWPAQSCSLHDRPFMSQAGRKRYFARSAARARGARRGKEKNKALFLFLFPSSSPRLALRARFALRANYRVRPAWLIKRLSCRLQSCDVRAGKGRFRCNPITCIFYDMV